MWVSCDDHTRVLAIACMLLAAATDNVIPADPAYLKRVAYLNKLPDLLPLFKIKFIEYISPASICVQPLASCASTEEETEQSRDRAETETHSLLSAFERFWLEYPRKVGKGDAERSWNRQKLHTQEITILTTLRLLKDSLDWTRDGGQYIPHPATWLNRKGWLDQARNNGNGHKRPSDEEIEAATAELRRQGAIR